MSTIQVTFPDIIDNHKYGENIYLQSLEQYSWIDRLYNQHEEKQGKINTTTQILNSANRLEAKIAEEETQRTKGDIDIITMLGQNIANTMQLGAIQINNMRNAIQTDIFLNEKRLTKTMSYTESTQTALTLHTMYSLNSSFISAFITNNSTFGAYRKQNYANMLSSHTMFMEAINNFTDLERLNIVRTSSLVATLLDGTERFNERLINQITSYNNFFVSTTSFTQQFVEFQNKEVVARIDKLTEGVDHNIDITNERINALYNRTKETYNWLYDGCEVIYNQVGRLSGLVGDPWPGYGEPFPYSKGIPNVPEHINKTNPPHNYFHKINDDIIHGFPVITPVAPFPKSAPAPAPPAPAPGPPAPAPAVEFTYETSVDGCGSGYFKLDIPPSLTNVDLQSVHYGDTRMTYGGETFVHVGHIGNEAFFMSRNYGLTVKTYHTKSGGKEFLSTWDRNAIMTCFSGTYDEIPIGDLVINTLSDGRFLFTREGLFYVRETFKKKVQIASHDNIREYGVYNGRLTQGYKNITYDKI